jgi:hypothetical protein
MTGNEMGKGPHANAAACYRQQKKCSKTTYEESLLEITKGKLYMIFVKTNLF